MQRRSDNLCRGEGAETSDAPQLLRSICQDFRTPTAPAKFTAKETLMGTQTGPDFSRTELIPAIAQDADTGDVLMMAWMNREAYSETLRSGHAVYFSRSRQKLWRKGEESGNVQELRAIYFDCDADTLLVKVNQIGGAACHEGYRSCFFRRIDPTTGNITVEGDRVFDPSQVYGK